MRFKKLIAASSITVILAGAGTSGVAHADDGRLLGALLGAAGGAAIGSNVGKGKGNVAAIAVGTLIGAGVGGNVGRSVSYNNHNYYGHRGAYPVVSNHHTKVYYDKHHHKHNKHKHKHKNKHGHNYRHGTYVIPNYQPISYGPVTTFNDHYCREFTQTIKVGGRLQESYGNACRQPDGSWEIQN